MCGGESFRRGQKRAPESLATCRACARTLGTNSLERALVPQDSQDNCGSRGDCLLKWFGGSLDREETTANCVSQRRICSQAPPAVAKTLDGYGYCVEMDVSSCPSSPAREGPRPKLAAEERRRVAKGLASGAGPATRQGTRRKGLGSQGNHREASCLVCLRIHLMMRWRKPPPECVHPHIQYPIFCFVSSSFRSLSSPRPFPSLTSWVRWAQWPKYCDEGVKNIDEVGTVEPRLPKPARR